MKHMKQLNIILISLTMLNLQASDSGRDSGLSSGRSSSLSIQPPTNFLNVLAAAAVAKKQHPTNPAQTKTPNKKQVVCPWPGCGKTISISHKKNHLNRHADIKAYGCEQCNKFFHYRHVLREHCKIEHGLPKTHKCTVCEKLFINKSRLNIHMRSHTGETPYECSFCSTGFTQSGNCKRHERSRCSKRPKS